MRIEEEEAIIATVQNDKYKPVKIQTNAHDVMLIM